MSLNNSTTTNPSAVVVDHTADGDVKFRPFVDTEQAVVGVQDEESGHPAVGSDDAKSITNTSTTMDGASFSSNDSAIGDANKDCGPKTSPSAKTPGRTKKWILPLSIFALVVVAVAIVLVLAFTVPSSSTSKSSDVVAADPEITASSNIATEDVDPETTAPSNVATEDVPTWWEELLQQAPPELEISHKDGLDGTIPSEIGLLTSVTSLSIMGVFAASLPTEIGLLTALTSLDILMSEINGTIPTEIGLLTAMTQFNVDSVTLTGSIPSELGLLTELTSWFFGDTFDLTGTIPHEIGALTAMEHMEFFYMTSLTGGIPSEIGLWTKLTYLEIEGSSSENGSHGPLPSEIGFMTDLTHLSLIFYVTGTLPSEIGLMTSLTHLHLGNNKLTGTIPSEIGSLMNLSWLSLIPNMMSGEIPTEIGLMTNIIDGLHLGLNLTGTISTDVCPNLISWKCDQVMCPYTCHCECSV